jgi:hypothetical protein
MGTFESLAGALAEALVPLADAFAPDELPLLLSELGLDDPSRLPPDAPFLQALAAAALAIEALVPRVDALAEAASDDGDAVQILEAAAALASAIRDVLTAVDAVATDLSRLAAANGLAGEVSSLVAELTRRVVERQIVCYLQDNHPIWRALLRFFGVVEEGYVEFGPAAAPQVLPYRRLHLDRAGSLVTDPLSLLEAEYGWGTDQLRSDVFFRRLSQLLIALELPGFIELDANGDEIDALDLFRAYVSPRRDLHPAGISLEVVDATAGVAVPLIEISPSWSLQLVLDGPFDEGLAVLLVPPAQVSFVAPAATNPASARFELVGASPNEGELLPLFGLAGAARVDAAKVAVSVGATFAPTGAEIALSADITGARAVLGGGDGDGFLAQILPRDGLAASFEFGLDWTSAGGLRLRGGVGLEVDLPVHVALGPLTVDRMQLLVRAGTEELGATIAASVAVGIGPLRAAVDGLGLTARLRFVPRGNLGVADLAIELQPPTGIGLSIDTSSVTLAGYLRIDPARGRYVGAVEVSLFKKLDLVAVGVLTTRMPDGSPGFSLIAVLSVGLPSPIPLGYNFYLTRIGGLLGLNRSVDLDALRRGLTTGAAENVLYPTDILARIDAIVTDLDTLFPQTRGQFVVGPTVEIVWNTPPLFKVKLGVLVEIGTPTRVAIVGAARVALPSEDEPLLDLKVAFLGTIDFDAGLLSFDASIYDSYIGRGGFKFSFEGDIAVRLSWGKQKDFLASVGGFHPAYTAPAYLRVPKLKRISLSLLKDNPRLKLTSYLALTTNTIQFGAELDFYFHVSHFSIVGDFGFDVLFQWSPFRFDAAVRAHLAVRAGDSDLLSLRLAFQLQGTTPWHAKGEASFGILFWTISVHFDKTWGEQVDLSLPSVAVLPAALDEFRRDLNWKAALSATATQLVQLFPTTGLVIDAAGILEISQALVPLGAQLSLFNNAAPSDISALDVHTLRIAGTLVTPHDVPGEFAPAAFRELSDQDKLAAASYETMKSGVAAAGADTLVADYLLGRPVTYERIVDDGTPAPPARSQAPASLATFTRLVRGGAVGSSPLSKKAAVDRQRNSVRDVALSDERFTVVTTSDLRAVDAGSHALSRSQAQARLGSLLASGHRADDLDIIPAYRAAS